MSMRINHIIFSGNLGGTPEMGYTHSGSAYTKFSVAINNDKKNRVTDSWDKDTIWVKVTTWGDLAEKVAGMFKVGEAVVVEGKLDQGEWTDAQGNKKNQPAVNAFKVHKQKSSEGALSSAGA